MQAEQATGQDQKQDEACGDLAADVPVGAGKKARILPASKISRDAMRFPFSFWIEVHEAHLIINDPMFPNF